MKTIPVSLQVIPPFAPKPFNRVPSTRANRSRLLAAILVAASALSFSGCATTDGPKDKQRALVCPQCKMVAVATTRPYWGYGRYSGLGQLPTTTYQDTCPGCQGVIETLFREGKWKHKCSICKDSPYTCPVFHP